MNTIISQTEKKKITAAHWTLFLICFICDAVGGTVSTLMSTYLPEVIKDMQLATATSDQASISGYINALFIFGWAFGGFSWGIISDRVGRKKALLFAIAWYGVFTFLTAIMQNWWGIVVCRFFSGFGVGGVLVISLTMVSEVWPTKNKSVFIGILSIAFPVGIFSAGLITYNIHAWRTAFMVVGAIPLLTAFISIWLIKESDVWLQDKQAFKLQNSKRQFIFSPVHKKELLIGSLTFGSMLIGLWAIFSWLPTWIQSLITNSDGQKERGLSMMLLGMGGLTGGFLSGWFLNVIGLRRAMLLCFSISAILSFILFKTNSSFSPIIYAEIAFMAFFFGISQGVLSYYIPQLFSTGIRSSATGFCFNIGRLFTGTAVLFVGILVTALGGYGNAIFTFSLVFVIGLAVVFFSKNMEKQTS